MTEDRFALRLRQIRRQAEHAIRNGQKLDPRLIHAMATGERKARA